MQAPKKHRNLNHKFTITQIKDSQIVLFDFNVLSLQSKK